MQELSMPHPPRIQTETPELEPEATSAGQSAVTARVVKVQYLPKLSDPSDPKNPFWTWGHEVEIANNLDRPITVLERHWNIQPFGDYEEQNTDAKGIGGRPFVIPAHSRRSYVSGGPFPTSSGGTMRGHYVVDLGNNTQTDVPIGPFDLTGFHGSAVKRQPPDIAQGPELLRELDLYIAECELLGSALLDTDRLPDTLRWPFQRLFLGQGKVTVFNSVKHGKFTKVDIRRALVLLYLVPKDFVTPLEKNYRLEYNDICLYGDGFDSLRVVLFYLKKPFTQVLTKWGVPERLHAEVAADIERLAKERAKAAQRPKWDERDRYAELRDLSSPEFLRRVYGDEIGEDGSIQKEVVRKIDAKLMAAVETYISAREGRRRDMGDAEGLHLIAGVRSRSKRAHLG